MKCSFLRFFILALSFTCSCLASTFSPNATYDTCFTPQTLGFFTTSCTDKIVNAIDRAQQQILVQAYSFTSASIAKALVNAKKRGVEIKVILDKSQMTQQYSSARFLANHKIPVWIDHTVAIAHNKVMIIDKITVIEGSFNFTKAAQQQNAENVNIITDQGFAENYLENWHKRQQVSIPYTVSDESVAKAKSRNYHSHSRSSSTWDKEAKRLLRHIGF